MKRMLFVFMMISSVISYCADQSLPKKQNIPQRFPTTLKSRIKPKQDDPTASKYDWYQNASSGDYIGFLQVKHWDDRLEDSKLSRRMSLGDK